MPCCIFTIFETLVCITVHSYIQQKYTKTLMHTHQTGCTYAKFVCACTPPHLTDPFQDSECHQEPDAGGGSNRSQQSEGRREDHPQTKDVLATESSGNEAPGHLSEEKTIKERRQYPTCEG